MAASESPFNIEAAKRELDERGVTVIPGVLDPQTCDEYVTEIRQWLDTFGTGFPKNINSIIHDYNISHHPVTWKVRHAVRPVFRELWGTDKLLTSLDGMAIGRPPEDSETNFYEPGNDNFHHDQGPHRLDLHAYQGAVYLEDAEEDDWCFQVIENSHKYFTDFFNVFDSGRSEFRRIKMSEKKWLEKRGCKAMRIPAKKGSIILWDSRTVHAGAPPYMGRQNTGRWRYVVFICMTPAKWATPSDINTKVTGFKKMLCSNHWPSTRMKYFPSRKSDGHVFTSLPEQAETDEAKRLVGLLPYDFEDGEPNGPPTPLFKEN